MILILFSSVCARVSVCALCAIFCVFFVYFNFVYTHRFPRHLTCLFPHVLPPYSTLVNLAVKKSSITRYTCMCC